MWTSFLISVLVIGPFYLLVPAEAAPAPAELENVQKLNTLNGLKGLKDQLEALQQLVIELQMRLASVEADAAAAAADVKESTTEKVQVDPVTISMSNADKEPTTSRDPQSSSPLATTPVSLVSTDAASEDIKMTELSQVTENTEMGSSLGDPTTPMNDPVTKSSIASTAPAPTADTTTKSTDPITTSTTTKSTDPSTSTEPATPPTLTDPLSTSTSTDLAAQSTPNDVAVTSSTTDPTSSGKSTSPDAEEFDRGDALPSPRLYDPSKTSSSTEPNSEPSMSDPDPDSDAAQNEPSDKPGLEDPPTLNPDEGTNDLPEPKTRIYTGPNLTGMHQDLNFDGKSSPNCLQVQISIESMDTFGSCVRLYHKPDCEGQSMAFYPQIQTTEDDAQNTKQNFLKSTRSVGPCLENELNGAQVEKNPDGTKSFRKQRGRDEQPLIPDLINLDEGDDNNLPSIPNGGPVKKCRTGYNNRVETIKADVTPNDLMRGQLMGPPSYSQADKDYYAKMDKQDGDQMGQFINSAFGPPPNLPFQNCFPQSQRMRQMMKKMEGQAMDWMNGGKNETRILTIRVFVQYASPMSTRPNGMTCLMNGVGGSGARFRRMTYLSNFAPIVRIPILFKINPSPVLLPPYYRIVLHNFDA